MRSKFVVFAQPRTGSTLLGELIASNPEVYFGDEPLATKVRSPNAAIRRLRWRHPRRAVGFHVTIEQLTDVQAIDDVGAWLRSVHARGWRVIALRRENLLRQVLSELSARFTNRYQDRSGEGEFVRVRPHVNPSDLLDALRLRTALSAAEAVALDGVPHLALSYEADLQDSERWAATTRRAFEFLDLEPVAATTSLRRLNPGPIETLVANYEDVRNAVAHTDYARFLD
jgi:LPS sulfotransferase NodH